MPIPESDPIVVAPTPTPFRDDDSLDLDGLAANVELWLETPLSGFVLGTANGEELALSDEERTATARTVVDAAEDRRLVIGGIDAPSASRTLAEAEGYAEAGVDLVRVRVPRGLSSDAVESYYREVTGGSAVPVIVAHQTGTGLPAASPETLGAVCGFDNVFGYITDHDVRFEGRVRQQVPRDRRFWICNGGLLLYGMLMGANGACMWLGNVAPRLCMDIVTMGLQGRFEEAMPLQARATRIDAVVIKHGVAGVKAALGILGYAGNRPRRPAESVGGEGVAEIEAVLRETGVLE